MPIDAFIDGLIDNEVIPGLTPTYTGGGPKVPDLQNFANLDPFGSLAQVPVSALGNYDFNALPPDKAADFLSKINLARDQNAPPRAMPLPGVIDPNALVSAPLSNGIPPLQHSIWTGNPLNANVPKQKAFMDALAKNKADNPAWTVVLWTDKSRAEINAALPGSDLGRMRQWAHDNSVVLANIDEIYAGNNKMILHEECRLEQNKAGTGRAATSDIVRMEVLNRFGGMYVDGDKQLFVPLDDITQSAHNNQVRLILPTGDPRGGPGVPPLPGKEKDEVDNHGKKIVEVNGFAVGNERGAVQNCAFCATKGNVVTQRMIETTQENYRKTRAELRNQSKMVHTAERGQRVEVIVRSGPSMMRDATSPDSAKPLMPLGSIKTYTGTTSWTGEKVYSGSKNVVTGIANIGVQPTVGNLELAATGAANPPPNLPGSRAPLTLPETAAFQKALRGSLTALSYTVANEGGKLDLNHIKPHLAGLTPQDQTLAVHAIVTSLTRPEFAGLASLVTDLRLPSGVTVGLETLDVLRTNAAFTGPINMSNFAVQEAALEGNLAFLRYANDNNLINLNAQSGPYLDGGMARVGSSTLEGQGGKLDPVQAAIIGGNSQALHYLMSLPGFANYNGKDAAIALAAKHGQVSNVIALAQKWNLPNSLGPSLKKLTTNIDDHVPKTDASRLGAIIEGAIGKDAALGTLLTDAADPLKTPLELQALNKQIEDKLHVLGIPNNDIDLLKVGGDLSATMRQHRVQGPLDTTARNLQIANTESAMGLAMLRDYRAHFGVAADLSSASNDLLCGAVQRGAMNEIPEMMNLGVSGADLNAGQKGTLALTFNRKAVDDGSCAQVLMYADALGVEDDVLIRAAQEQNSMLITTSMNLTRPLNQQIVPGQFDAEAELAIAQVKFQNSEAGKNDYKNVQVNTLTPAQARELVQKAMVYSHDRLRAGEDGKTSRVQGWQGLLTQIQNEPTLNTDPKLMAMVQDTHAKLGGMITNNHTVRDQFRQAAAALQGPDLSQRQATSVKGRVREFFKPTPPPAQSPAGQRFVPGKGMQ